MHSIVRASLLASTLFGLLAAPSASQAAYSVAGASQASFQATGPAGIKIIGHTSELRLADDGTTLTVAVPLGHVETGIGLRDTHMREKYLEVAKYPEARLGVARAALRPPTDGGPTDADAMGELSLHGVKKKVTFHYHAERVAGTVRVSGKLRLDMNDYGVAVPSYLGVTVKPGIDVSVEFSVKDG